MLHALLEHLDTGEFGDNGFVRLSRVTHQSGTIDLLIQTGLEGEADTAQTWIVSCARVYDFRFLSDPPDPFDLLTDPSHPAIRQHAEPRGDLVFTGPPLHTSTILGQLWTAHRQVSDAWIPFERYLNPLVPVDQLLAGGHGKLATGPLFLLHAYASVLRANNYAVSPFLERPSPLSDVPLAMLRLGTSFVVAEKFTATAA